MTCSASTYCHTSDHLSSAHGKQRRHAGQEGAPAQATALGVRCMLASVRRGDEDDCHGIAPNHQWAWLWL